MYQIVVQPPLSENAVMVTSSAANRHTFFHALAVSNRVRAAKTSNATVAQGYLRLADGYEVLAKGFADLSQRQPLVAQKARVMPDGSAEAQG